MRRAWMVVILLAGSLCIARPGAALDDAPRNALRHVGEVLAIAKLCDKLRVNQASVVSMVYLAGGDLSRPDHYRVAEEQARADLAAWKGRSTDAACLAGMMLYGPSGSTVPGLVSLTR